jgi:hypothetical protein
MTNPSPYNWRDEDASEDFDFWSMEDHKETQDLLLVLEMVFLLGSLALMFCLGLLMGLFL